MRKLFNFFYNATVGDLNSLACGLVKSASWLYKPVRRFLRCRLPLMLSDKKSRKTALLTFNGSCGCRLSGYKQRGYNNSNGWKNKRHRTQPDSYIRVEDASPILSIVSDEHADIIAFLNSFMHLQAFRILQASGWFSAGNLHYVRQNNVNCWTVSL
jgi:hypothetical protein